MAFTFGFFNSLKGDRRYNAEQFGELFDGILRDGVLASIGQVFAVTTANNGMQINVGTGRAWFNHTWNKNDSVMVLTVPNSDTTRARYDAVILEVNQNDEVRANSIKIVQGEPLVNPLKPSLVNTEKIHQYPLAYIRVEAGVEVIAASKIENMVGREPTVFATGVLEAVKIDALWAQWNGEFTEWFDNIKAQLSGNIATNLQNQIDSLRSSIPLKATDAETLTGTNTTKYTTPSGVKAAIDSSLNYVSNDSGKKYRLIERDVLPRLSPDAFTKNIHSSAGTGRIDSYTAVLKDYTVIHYKDQILIIDKNGNTRTYTVNCTTVYGNSGPYVSAIRNTNQYFVFGVSGTSNTITRITIGSSSPIVSQYYLLPSSSYTFKALFYVNADYSVLLFEGSNMTISIYRLSNSYVEQPTIYNNVTFQATSGYSNVINGNYIRYGASGKYLIQYRFEQASVNSSTGKRNTAFTYQYVDLETGTISSPKTIKAYTSMGEYAFIRYIDYVLDDNGKYYFTVFYAHHPNNSAVYTNQESLLVTFDGNVSSTKSLTTLFSTLSLDEESTLMQASYFDLHLVDVESGYFYLYLNSQHKRYRLNYRSGGSENVKAYPDDRMVVNVIHGASKYIRFSYQTVNTYLAPSPILTDVEMTGELIGLEIAQISMYSNTYAYYSRPIPTFMAFNRFLYCSDHGECTLDYSGYTHYDLEVRTFVGIQT